MLRCSPKAYAQCPDRHLCGPIEDATFTEGSECAVFNRAVEAKPMTNADRIQSMGDKEFGNAPLTLDQLIEMDGEPVWLVDGGGNEMWGLVDTGNDHIDVIDSQSGLWRGEFYNMSGDGKNGLHLIGWLAYRQKPEVATK